MTVLATAASATPPAQGGNPNAACDGTHHSDTDHGANRRGAYDETCDGSPSKNGSDKGTAAGKPCAGCVGNADDKNPKGQAPSGTDRNAGYECDRNQGVGKSNPAHTGCAAGDTDPTSTGGRNGSKATSKNPPKPLEGPAVPPGGAGGDGGGGGGNDAEVDSLTTPKPTAGRPVFALPQQTGPEGPAVVLGDTLVRSLSGTTSAGFTIDPVRLGNELPRTGAGSVPPLIAMAFALVAAGTALVRGGRRRGVGAAG